MGPVWIGLDQRYRNSYVFATVLNPRAAIPTEWYQAGITHKAKSPRELARAAGPPEQAFVFEAIAASPTAILARWTLRTDVKTYQREGAHDTCSARG